MKGRGMTIQLSEHLQRNKEINQQIYSQGPALFEAVKQTVLDKATVPQEGRCSSAHKENQRKLQSTIERICQEGRWNPGLSKQEFWSIGWGRIVYQGTRAAKASDEIKAMPTQIPLFRGYQNFDPNIYQFDKAEWDRFSAHWKRRFAWYELVQKSVGEFEAEIDVKDVARLATRFGKDKKRVQISEQENDFVEEVKLNEKDRSNESSDALGKVLWGSAPEDWVTLTQRWSKSQRHRFDNWLSFAKAQEELWRDSLDGFAHKNSEALCIMLKCNQHEGIKFSAHGAKMVKYLKVAAFLRDFKGEHILQHYTGADYEHNVEHFTGERYKADKAQFWKIHGAFSAHFGPITSLHLMMDLGFKTVKPDRVLTYLFSQLGWLITLPSSLTQKQVLASYTQDAVIREVLHRADVLAASLAPHAPTPYTHRLLDIWFVKFGQEPEEQFGITVKLEGKDGEGLRNLYEEVQRRLQAQQQVIAPGHDLSDNFWPTVDVFFPAAYTTGEGSSKAAQKAGVKVKKKPIKLRKMTREAAGVNFSKHWKSDLLSAQPMYPPRIDNKPKEAILRLIERGTDPGEAFTRVLGLPTY